jgi:hypothetical protein
VFPNDYQGDIAGIEGHIDRLYKILPASDAALNIHEDETGAEVLIEVIKQTACVCCGITASIANINSIHREAFGERMLQPLQIPVPAKAILALVGRRRNKCLPGQGYLVREAQNLPSWASTRTPLTKPFRQHLWPQSAPRPRKNIRPAFR